MTGHSSTASAGPISISAAYEDAVAQNLERAIGTCPMIPVVKRSSRRRTIGVVGARAAGSAVSQWERALAQRSRGEDDREMDRNASSKSGLDEAEADSRKTRPVEGTDVAPRVAEAEVRVRCRQSAFAPAMDQSDPACARRRADGFLDLEAW